MLMGVSVDVGTVGSGFPNILKIGSPGMVPTDGSDWKAGKVGGMGSLAGGNCTCTGTAGRRSCSSNTCGLRETFAVDGAGFGSEAAFLRFSSCLCLGVDVNTRPTARKTMSLSIILEGLPSQRDAFSFLRRPSSSTITYSMQQIVRWATSKGRVRIACSNVQTMTRMPA